MEEEIDGKMCVCVSSLTQSTQTNKKKMTQPSVCAQRCNPDHLSTAFSFLAPHEMAAASSVSRTWHTIGERRTAWVTLDVDQLISNKMRHANYEPDCVAAKIHSTAYEEMDMEPLADLIQICRSRVWKQTSDLRVNFCPLQSPQQIILSLGTIAQMQHLRSLRLVGLNLPGKTADSALGACLSSLAPRLLVFSFISEYQYPDILYDAMPLLTHLRVLELSGGRGGGRLDANALLALHELEYLQLHDRQIDADLCMVV